jgi:nucleolar GTP-binding protein
VKFTQQTIIERLLIILNDFPRLNDIHPFYSDLCNTLYDRDHYKLALGQLNISKTHVDMISRDMIRMIKYGDTLYRCKCLKRAALGRMCTILKRCKASLLYLEEVRKHISRLPALDPNTRTILMCGLPNVGKSSFMNKITNGNVDVQPYAFTTKSLFVGHMDYKYLRWQVIDTPGILDHTLEERNTIEMQAIIALAHLTCTVLYFMDISEQCGYTIQQQCSLFRSIKPLFANKQLIIVMNKIDIQPYETLEQDKKEMIDTLVQDTNCTILQMSNISEYNISQVKAKACDLLLDARVDHRIATNKVDSIMNRLQVFLPKPRDTIERTCYIPQSVLEEKLLISKDHNMNDDHDDDAITNGKNKNKQNNHKSRTGYAPTKYDTITDPNNIEMSEMTTTTIKKTARDIMWENGGPGVWGCDYRDVYDLNNEEWKYDTIPEIINGKNIADYIDADILYKLEQLEREEEQIVNELNAAKMGQTEDDIASDLDEEEHAAVEAIRERKRTIKNMKNAIQSNNKPVISHARRGLAKDKHDTNILTTSEIKKRMDTFGIDSTLLIERHEQRGRSKTRNSNDNENDDDMENDTTREERGRKRERSSSVRRSIKKGEATTNDDTDMDIDISSMSKGKQKEIKKLKSSEARREVSLARSHSKPQRDPSLSVGLKDDDAVKVAKQLNQYGQRTGWFGSAGEGDNRKAVHLVKWMNTGKKRNGTHYCR